MIKVKFNDKYKLYEVDFRRISDHVVFIIGNENYQDTSGFLTFTEDMDQLGNFSDYKTIYRTLINGVQFSDDGSTYVEPTKSEEINVTWFTDKEIPDSIDITYVDHMDTSHFITITAEDGWKYIVNDIPISANIRVTNIEEIPNYIGTIEELNIRYIYHSSEPSWEEKMEAQLTYTALMTDTLIDMEEE